MERRMCYSIGMKRWNHDLESNRMPEILQNQWKAVPIIGVTKGALPPSPSPLRSIIFSISRSFLENLAKLYVGALPYGESWIRPCQYISGKFQFVSELDQFSWIKGLFLLLFQRESVQVGYSLWTEQSSTEEWRFAGYRLKTRHSAQRLQWVQIPYITGNCRQNGV